MASLDPEQLEPKREATENELWQVRSLWEFAALVHFLNTFHSIIQLPSGVLAHAEAVEECLCDPDSHLLAELHVKLLNALLHRDDINYNLFKDQRDSLPDGSDNKNMWQDVLAQVLTETEDSCNPLAKKSYLEVTPMDRTKMLYSICNLLLTELQDVDPKAMDNSNQYLQRGELIGSDTQNNNYWYFGDNRLYREMPLMEGTKSRMSAGRGSARVSRSRSLTTVHTEEDIVDTFPEEAIVDGQLVNFSTVRPETVSRVHMVLNKKYQWETVCVTSSDWVAFISHLSPGKSDNEKKLHKVLEQGLSPIVLPVLQAAEREAKRLKALGGMPRKRSYRIQRKEILTQEEQRIKREEEKLLKSMQKIDMAEAERAAAQKRKLEEEKEQQQRQEEREQRLQERRRIQENPPLEIIVKRRNKPATGEGEVSVKKEKTKVTTDHVKERKLTGIKTGKIQQSVTKKLMKQMKRKQQMSMNASMGQQRSRIFYVFSSAMANSATVAVNENQFSTIVDYHMHVQENALIEAQLYALDKEHRKANPMPKGSTSSQRPLKKMKKSDDWADTPAMSAPPKHMMGSFHSDQFNPLLMSLDPNTMANMPVDTQQRYHQVSSEGPMHQSGHHGNMMGGFQHAVPAGTPSLYDDRTMRPDVYGPTSLGFQQHETPQHGAARAPTTGSPCNWDLAALHKLGGLEDSYPMNDGQQHWSYGPPPGIPPYSLWPQGNMSAYSQAPTWAEPTGRLQNWIGTNNHPLSYEREQSWAPESGLRPSQDGWAGETGDCTAGELGGLSKAGNSVEYPCTGNES